MTSLSNFNLFKKILRSENVLTNFYQFLRKNSKKWLNEWFRTYSQDNKFFRKNEGASL